MLESERRGYINRARKALGVDQDLNFRQSHWDEPNVLAHVRFNDRTIDGKRTLFMGGQYDEARPSTLAAFAARVPGAEFATIPGAAHGIFADRPQETVALIRAWLARQDALA